MICKSTFRKPFLLSWSSLFAFFLHGTKKVPAFCLITFLVLALFVPSAVAQSSTNIPVFQFAALYNMDMDFTPGQPMTVNGKVHVNGNIWLYPQATVTFNDSVEATLWATNQDTPNDQQNLPAYLPPTYSGGNPLSGVGRLDMLINTTNVETILNLPPPGLGVTNDAAYMPSNHTARA